MILRPFWGTINKISNIEKPRKSYKRNTTIEKRIWGWCDASPLSLFAMSEIFFPVFFIYCQFPHLPIIFHFRHVGVREMHGVADLAIGTVQWCNANLLTEISLRRTVSPPVKTSGSYITAKQFKNRCAFPALKIFSASLHVTILLIYYSTILLLY